MRNRFGRMACALALACLLLALGFTALAENGVLELPLSLTAIEAEAFYGVRTLGRVVIPEGTKTIGSRAFANCSLTEVELPDSLTDIADDAFDGSNLYCVYASEGSYACSWATRHGYAVAAFESPAGDFTYTLENGECTITGYVGQSEVVNIPKTLEGCPVTCIGSGAFYSNKVIQRVVIPEGVKTIGSSAFMRCTNLIEVKMPNTVDMIYGSAFSACKNLTDINLSSGLTVLREDMFLGCSSLKRIEIPEGVTTIWLNAFQECVSLTEVTLPKSVTSIMGWVFSYCESLTDVVIPDGVTALDSGTFYGCSSLKRVAIPRSVVELDERTFEEADNVTLYGFADSAAAQFAGENDIPFVAYSVDGLASSESSYFTNNGETALFTVRATDGFPVTLWCEESARSLGEMHDDGQSGDAAAGDGIYSLRLPVEDDAARIAHFYAEYCGLRSNEVEVTFYVYGGSNPSESYNTLVSIEETLGGADSAFIDASGYVPAGQEENALQAVAAAAENLVRDGYAVSWRRSDDAVFVRTMYGVTVAYTPPIYGSASAPSKHVVSLRPSARTFDDLGDEDGDFYKTLPAIVASNIEDAIPRHTWNADDPTDRDVTLARVNSLGANSIILWNGHGLYDPENGCYLTTGEKCTNDFFKFTQDYIQDRLMLNTADYYLFGPEYIKHYMHAGQLSHSLVWVSACYSGKDGRLAEALRSKGAEAVVVYTDISSIIYGNGMMKAVIGRMTERRGGAGNYYTLGEALKLAEEKMGKNDYEYSIEKLGVDHESNPWITRNTRCIIVGDQNYRLLNLGCVYGVATLGSNLDGAGITVTLYRNGKVVATTETDERGNYSICSEGDYEGTLKFSFGSYESSYPVTMIEENTIPLNVNLPWPIARVTGAVKIGSRINGDGVTVTLYRDGKAVATTETDEKGNYTIWSEGNAQGTVKFSIGSFETSYPVTLNENNTILLNVELMWPVQATARVIDAQTGKNIQGASFDFVDSAGNAPKVSWQSGEYTVDANYGWYIATVSARGYASKEVVLDLTDPGTGVVVALTPDGSVTTCDVTGRVYRAGSVTTPVTGAQVQFYKDGSLIFAKMGSEGAFTVTLESGTYQVTAKAEGYRDYTGSFTAAAGSDNALEIPMEPEEEAVTEGTAAGQIINTQTGEGEPGVTLRVRKGKNSAEDEDVVATTQSDADGRYSLTLPLGEYTVTMSKAGFVSDTFTIEVKEGTTSGQDGQISPEEDLGEGFHLLFDFDGCGKFGDDCEFNPTGFMGWDVRKDLDQRTGQYEHFKKYGTEIRDKVYMFIINPAGGLSACLSEACTKDVNEPIYLIMYYDEDKIEMEFEGEIIDFNIPSKKRTMARLYNGNELIHEFSIADLRAEVNEAGSSFIWNLCAIAGDTVIIRNTITKTPDIDYAG